MTSEMQGFLVSVAAVGLWIAMPAAAHAQDARDDGAELKSSSFVVGDVLVAWQSGQGATVAYRGLPVLLANPAEFVVHQRWQKVLYRNGQSEPSAVLQQRDGRGALSIRDRTEHFEFEKRVIVKADGAIRLEYKYELLDPEEAEIQVLFGVGKPWLDGASYRIVVNGDERKGKLVLPQAGRIDPWQNATEQSFTTDFGTLTVRAERPLNLYCDPAGGRVWWSQALARGEKYAQNIDIRVKPGEASDTGLIVAGLEWPRRVRSGQATFSLKLARTKDGPKRVAVRVEPAAGGKREAGAAVEATLTRKPTRVKCEVNVPGKGHVSFAAVITNPDDGTEILRIAPLLVESSPLLRVMPRLSLYTHERQAEIVADVADDVELDGLTLELEGENVAGTRKDVAALRTMIPLDVTGLPDGASEVTCRLLRGRKLLAAATTQLRKAPPKPNEVKIDNLTRGLIADGLPFIPFGFYTYYPLAEGVMDGEVVNGFNLFSPYHGGPHSAEDLEPIREYMDRCAAIGMRVNYHLMWSNRTEMTDEQWALLRAEIEAFRDHPALLSWYIADEPPAEKASHLQEVADLLRELDPYHPVTIVFCRGASHARLFAGAMDIVMADPYPIPNRPVTSVSDTADAFNEAFDFRKPLWIVPQAFGGNEGWRREPTAREQRAMTYLALIHGARAIQYFIRKPRVSFPKSPVMWSECGRLALETAELTPALLSAEQAPSVASSSPSVHACAFRDRGIVTVLAVNTENQPQTVRLQLDGVEYTGEADALFEDRRVAVNSGAIEEPIDAFGTRAYSIPVGPLPEDDIAIAPGNLTYNPSWEYTPSVGTPAGCYAGIGDGATCFVDSRVARHGRHSLRMIAPAADQTPSISPFPVRVKGGQEYRVSIWAKAKTDGVMLKVSLGSLHAEEFSLTTEWQEYSFTVTPEQDAGRMGSGIALVSPGVAWLDLFQIVPVKEENG